jgi:hypothetical protein
VKNPIKIPAKVTTFPGLLDWLKETRRLSLLGIAKELQITPSSIYFWRDRNQRPDEHSIRKIADKFSLDAWEIEDIVRGRRSGEHHPLPITRRPKSSGGAKRGAAAGAVLAALTLGTPPLAPALASPAIDGGGAAAAQETRGIMSFSSPCLSGTQTILLARPRATLRLGPRGPQ